MERECQAIVTSAREVLNNDQLLEFIEYMRQLSGTLSECRYSTRDQVLIVLGVVEEEVRAIYEKIDEYGGDRQMIEYYSERLYGGDGRHYGTRPYGLLGFYGLVTRFLDDELGYVPESRWMEKAIYAPYEITKEKVLKLLEETVGKIRALYEKLGEEENSEYNKSLYDGLRGLHDRHKKTVLYMNSRFGLNFLEE